MRQVQFLLDVLDHGLAPNCDSICSFYFSFIFRCDGENLEEADEAQKKKRRRKRKEIARITSISLFLSFVKCEKSQKER